MFILRRINGEGVQSNQCLGTSYHLVPSECQERFNETVALNKFYEIEKENIYAFLIHLSGSDVIPLYKSQQNYIMTSDGKTFSNLTFKS